MKIVLAPACPSGKIGAIASKSVAHRALICAAFAEGNTRIYCRELNEDIIATAGCLSALGATVKRDGDAFDVTPVDRVNKNAVLDCNESGSTLRFILPITCFLGADSSFKMSGRLPNRPLSPLREELIRCGISFSEEGSNPLLCLGEVKENEFTVAGNVSSQFISGLLFAIAISGRGGRLHITGGLESAPYVDLTVRALRLFGVRVYSTVDGYEIKKEDKLVSPRELYVEGDWSNASFPLAMGAIGGGAVTVTGLDMTSPQGDRAVVDILSRFGAVVDARDGEVTVSRGDMRGIEIDAAQIPDLVPVLATVASVCRGRTRIYNASRLRIKESDRLLSTSNMINSLGGCVTVLDDGLVIDGVASLTGGRVSSFGDHRIAMSAAVASVACMGEIEIEGAEACAKSYPSFWQDVEGIGLAPKYDNK